MIKFFKNIVEEIREIKSDKKQLREFGFVMAIFFALLAGFAVWKGKSWPLLAVVAAVFALTAWIRPFLLKPLQQIWMTLAVVIGWFMSRLILSIVFFLVITPLSLFMRLTGKKFLDMEFRTQQSSYWIPKNKEGITKECYEKQY